MTIKNSIITLTGEYTIANGEDNLRTKAGRQTLTELVDIVKTLLTKLGKDTTKSPYNYILAYSRGWAYPVNIDDTTRNDGLARSMHRAIFKDSKDDRQIAFDASDWFVYAYKDNNKTIHIEIADAWRKVEAQAILEEVR